MATNTISHYLGLTDIELDFSNVDFEHTDSVPCFPGWQKGEMSEEHRKNLSIAASKRIRTEDHIQKLHEGRRNSKNSTEHTAKLIASRLGTNHSQETKEKMSAAKLKDENRFSNARKAARISADKRKDDPNYKLLQSQRTKEIWEKRRLGLLPMPSKGK
jgi:hypothetical protein